MKYFKLEYADGRSEIVKGLTVLEVVKAFDLATRDNINTRIIELDTTKFKEERNPSKK